ncbi:MAG: hypothetical protein GXO39_00715 [Thermotogae bacterium]|nr:hypothetical protein [Thermotogota bacterium]
MTLKERLENVKRIFPKADSALIAALHEVQDEYGWIHPDGIKLINEVLGYGETQIVSVASFYHFFHLEPTPKHKLSICTNLACMQKGAYDLLKLAKEKADPKKVFVEETECIGLCDHAPAGLLNGTPLKDMTPQLLEDLLENPDRYDEGHRETYEDLTDLYENG